VKACLQYMKINEGVEIHHVADLPARTGLGTSSAFTVGLLLGLKAMQGEMCDRQSLAEAAVHVEQDIIEETVGSQDQVSAAFGGFNRIDFQTNGQIDVNRIVLSSSRLTELQDHLVLYFTGFSRTASEIAHEQVRLTPQRGHELRTMYQLVGEAESILSSNTRRMSDFGRLLHESWQIKRSLTNKVSNSSIDEIYEAGLSAGAIGGKLLGAGGGGFMLFYIAPERQAELRARLKKLLCVPFKFNNRGSHVVVSEPEEIYNESLAHDRSLIYA
jgi:D-glycero-alpha-D-manno-heptose-7-phosphate kinase